MSIIIFSLFITSTPWFLYYSTKYFFNFEELPYSPNKSILFLMNVLICLGTPPIGFAEVKSYSVFLYEFNYSFAF